MFFLGREFVLNLNNILVNFWFEYEFYDGILNIHQIPSLEYILIGEMKAWIQITAKWGSLTRK